MRRSVTDGNGAGGASAVRALPHDEPPKPSKGDKPPM
jgi:hypothetical protein